MEISMLDMAVKAAAIVFDPNRLMFLAIGVFMGLVVGVIPGIGLPPLSMVMRSPMTKRTRARRNGMGHHRGSRRRTPG